MTFDALTIAGIVLAALSGGFVLGTAAIHVPRSVHRWPSSTVLATRIRVHMNRPALPAFRRAAQGRLRPLTAATIKA